MTDSWKVIKGLECCASMNGSACRECPYSSECVAGEATYQTGTAHLAADALALLKEQEAMNVDAFLQWCIDSHIMGDATVRGIKYWVEKYKEIKKGR